MRKRRQEMGELAARHIMTGDVVEIAKTIPVNVLCLSNRASSND